jgi:hypothetical protein
MTDQSKSQKQRKYQENKPIDDRQVKNAVVSEAIGAPKREHVAPPTPAPAPVRAGAAASPQPGLLAKPSKHVIESAVDTMERSLKAAGQGTVAVNRKLIDIARANVASGLDLALDLATAKNPIEMARVQMAFWDEQMKALASQAQELRTLSAEMVAQASEPISEHVKRS